MRTLIFTVSLLAAILVGCTEKPAPSNPPQARAPTHAESNGKVEKPKDVKHESKPDGPNGADIEYAKTGPNMNWLTVKVFFPGLNKDAHYKARVHVKDAKFESGKAIKDADIMSAETTVVEGIKGQWWVKAEFSPGRGLDLLPKPFEEDWPAGIYTVIFSLEGKTVYTTNVNWTGELTTR